MGRLFDLQIDFFIPVWRRVLLVVFCLGWAGIEFATGAPFWGVVFGGMGVLAYWQFFMEKWPDAEDQADQTSESQVHSDGDNG